jgi:arsenite-transporting ATPase
MRLELALRVNMLFFEKMAEALKQSVVVDTAPTGHTLRLLAVPETLGRIATVLDEMLAKHHFLLTRLGGADRRDAADHLVAEIDAEARRLAALLRDPCRSRFRWMVLPEMLAVEEAQDAVQALEGGGIAVDAILVNRVAGIGKTGRTVDRRRVAAEQRAVAAVRKAFGGRPIRLLPELAAETAGQCRAGWATGRWRCGPRREPSWRGCARLTRRIGHLWSCAASWARSPERW